MHQRQDVGTVERRRVYVISMQRHTETFISIRGMEDRITLHWYYNYGRSLHQM